MKNKSIPIWFIEFGFVKGIWNGIAFVAHKNKKGAKELIHRELPRLGIFDVCKVRKLFLTGSPRVIWYQARSKSEKLT